MQRNTDAIFRKSSRLWSWCGMGISPSTHTLISTYCIFTFTNHPGYACWLAVMLMNADICATPPHPPNTDTYYNCSPQLRTLCDRSMCRYHRTSISSVQRTSVLHCFDLLGNATHSAFFLISASSKFVLLSLLSEAALH